MSPILFILALDPVHKIVRDSKRGCTVKGLEAPTGSDGYVDDLTLHMDGPDAVPAMQCTLDEIIPFVQWLSMFFKVPKCKAGAADFKTNQSVPTADLSINGVPIPTLAPDEASKHLGTLITIIGDYTAEKERLCQACENLSAALVQSKDLTPPEKEMVFKIGVVTVFRYGCAFVPFTGLELDKISAQWILTVKKLWRLPVSADSSMIALDQKDDSQSVQTPR